MRYFFKKNKAVLEIAMLFIGTVIGAGFATGREVLLFFREQNLVVVILAGIILGALCGLFLAFGKIKNKIGNKLFICLNKIMEIFLWISAIFTFLTMVCGGESIIFNCFRIQNIGLWTGIFIAVLSVFDIKFVKIINNFLVPIIVIMIVFLTFFSTPTFPNGINFGKAIEYCAMNIMLGGYVVCDEGEKMSSNQIINSSILVAIIFGFMLVCVYLVAMSFPSSEMPIFALASSKGYGIISGIIIYAAIFTTMIGSGKMISQNAYKILPHYIPNVFFLILLSIFSFNWNFAHTVDLLFPLSAYVGIVYLVLVFVEILYYFLQQYRYRFRNDKIVIASQSSYVYL